VQKGTPAPPSLQNIFKELNSELGVAPPGHGCLADWAERGVLLLNTVLTVREGAANSHKDRGWETFTDRVISLLSDRDEPMVFMLWGANAKSKAPLITNYRHLTLSAAHPSPLSAHNGFFGCGHFRKANEFLAELGKSVDWEIR
jgi:uracil-DNA glycosylase